VIDTTVENQRLCHKYFKIDNSGRTPALSNAWSLLSITQNPLCFLILSGLLFSRRDDNLHV